jgi:hypothetical protein
LNHGRALDRCMNTAKTLTAQKTPELVVVLS